MTDDHQLNDGFQLLKDWRAVDTSRAEALSDERLIEMLEGVYMRGGWGLIAELMKRYTKIKDLKP